MPILHGEEINYYVINLFCVVSSVLKCIVFTEKSEFNCYVIAYYNCILDQSFKFWAATEYAMRGTFE